MQTMSVLKKYVIRLLKKELMREKGITQTSFGRLITSTRHYERRKK